MSTLITKNSPRFLARTAGLFFLLTILGGVFAQAFVSERLIDFHDAAATATNILAHKGLYQLGFTVYLIEMLCQVVALTFFYLLLRPVSNSVALTAAFVELSGCIIKTFARVFFIVPLLILSGTPMLSAFSPAQLQSVALLLLKVNDQGAAVALAFFGCSTLLSGYLAFRSTFLPRFLGVLGMISGLGWLAFLYPALGYRVFPFIALIGLLSAAAMIFWLLAFGVNEERWKVQSAAAALTGNP